MKTSAASVPARLLLAVLAGVVVCVQGGQQCDTAPPHVWDYSAVFQPLSSAELTGLPGFTRSSYASDHALVTKESRVWASINGWKNTLLSHIISPTPSKQAHFTMYLADMKNNSEAGPQLPAVERFIFVVEGEVQVKQGSKSIKLPTNHWAYFGPAVDSKMVSKGGAGLVVFERLYGRPDDPPGFLHGNTEDSPVLPADPEVFVLRKLLPATPQHDFNVHVMDFQPGEYLYVKEVHYNQHGLLLLQGQGIYRLGSNWMPVQAGDAIWMGPYVPQWYGALGPKPSRYILYKDTTIDPLVSP